MIIDKPLYYPQPGLYSALEFYTVIITNQTKLTVLSISLNYLKWRISYPLNQLFHGFTIKSLEKITLKQRAYTVITLQKIKRWV